jgi:hypothetical protein
MASILRGSSAGRGRRAGFFAAFSFMATIAGCCGTGRACERMSSPDPGFGLLTVTEVAELLHCSKAHGCNVLAGLLRGCVPIPSVRLGRRTLVRRGSLLHWIEQNEAANDNVESPPRSSGVENASRRRHA